MEVYKTGGGTGKFKMAPISEKFLALSSIVDCEIENPYDCSALPEKRNLGKECFQNIF